MRVLIGAAIAVAFIVPAYAQEPDLLEKAALAKVAAEQCPGTFRSDVYEGLVWAAAAKANASVVDTSAKAVEKAQAIAAQINSPERQAEFCAWAKAAAATMTPG